MCKVGWPDISIDLHTMLFQYVSIMSSSWWRAVSLLFFSNPKISQERSDPYVIVKVGAIQRRPVIGGISGGNLDRRWLDRTPTIDNDLNPDW